MLPFFVCDQRKHQAARAARQEGWSFMLTLKNLKSMVENVPSKKAAVPGIRQLEESDARILVREMISDMLITVYQNGYVACRRGRESTVFRLHDCGGYTYWGALEENEETVAQDVFENENWYIRLYLEAEDRLNANYERKQRRHQISLDALYADHCCDMADFSRDGLTVLIQKETVVQARAYRRHLTEKQEEVVRLYFDEKMGTKEIADKLQKSPQAVSDMIKKAINRVRRKEGIKAVGIPRGVYNCRAKKWGEDDE